MPVFEWKGFNPKGKTISGVVDADSPRDARVKLKRDKVMVTTIKPVKGAGGLMMVTKSKKPAKKKLISDQMAAKIAKARGRSGGGAKGKKRLGEVSTFTRQLSTLMKASIPITEALRAIIDQTEGKRMGVLYRDIRERISQGATTADALAAHPDYFDELYVSMVRSGEAAGRLDDVLDRLSIFLQGQAKVRNRISAALAYPAVMLIVGLIIVGVLMVNVVPKITQMLAGRGQELPAATQFLQNVSEFLTAYWWLLFLGSIFSLLVFNLYYSSEKGRLSIDSKLLKVPVLGDLLAKQALSRFSQTFSTLLRSGVPVVRCLEVTKTVLGNRLLENTIDGVRAKILEGADIATPIKQSGVFPPIVGYMIAVGEQSGELDSMMEQVGESYQEEVEVATGKFTSLIEPMIILLLACLVGFIVIAILLPIMQMSSSFGS
ncbi:MAG: type II secretion system F family protein [Planctomycetes bacterium]|nr:type II secretion system F family protein [Planctomycetota bacterium]NQU50317.1 type II secretion system F family protein [Planctomycetota bacterium]